MNNKKELQKAYYQAHKEEMKARAHAWNQQHKDKRKQFQAKYMLKKMEKEEIKNDREMLAELKKFEENIYGINEENDPYCNVIKEIIGEKDPFLKPEYEVLGDFEYLLRPDQIGWLLCQAGESMEEIHLEDINVLTYQQLADILRILKPCGRVIIKPQIIQPEKTGEIELPEAIISPVDKPDIIQ